MEWRIEIKKDDKGGALVDQGKKEVEGNGC